MFCNLDSKEWPSVKLEDVAQVLGGYAFKSKEFSSKGNPIIKIKNVNGRIVDKNDCDLYPVELCKNLSKFILNNNDILIAMTGAGSVGRVSKFVQYDNQTYYLNQRVGKIIVQESLLDNEYLFQLLSTKRYEKILFDLANGSGQPNLSPKTIGLLEIPLPPLNEQRAIADILSSLDEKIELNNEMNETLEEMAQALFKRWFVDFEFPNKEGQPYKSSGGEMVESELGMIPKGWSVKGLGELINISSGKRPSKKSSEKDKGYRYPLIGASSIMGYVLEPLCEDKILVIGRVGTHGVVQRFCEPVWPSDNTLVIRTIYYEFINQILQRIDYSAINRGSTQPLITQTDIKNTKIIVPDKNLLKVYEEKCESLFNMIEHNEIEKVYLGSLRDTLLPKLMSGEIRVSDLN